VAEARVREVRAETRAVRSRLLPGVDASGGFSRNRLSGNGVLGEAVEAIGQDLTQSSSVAGLDLNWELDVFGGRRRALEAARADLGMTEAAEQAIRISIVAEVGRNYLEVRGRQKQLGVARANLRSQESTLALTVDRRRAGLSSDLDVARAEAQTAETRSQIPLMEESLQRAIHRVGVLMGQSPTELAGLLGEVRPLPVVSPGIPVGLPSDLLRRRPDVLMAERELAAATARIGVATAELFPKFYLTGAAGLQSVDASDFFTGGSRFWALGPSFRWPVFSAGRIRSQIQAQNARQQQAALRYEQVVLTSLEEAENALVGYGQEQRRLEALVAAEASSRRAVNLAQERYRGGLVDFLNVLEAERSLYRLQEQQVASELQLQQKIVRLYRALGGGWTPSSRELAAR
jgi:NodT family efflux transporter outer membrane factor (OMF) lipoprotein